MQAIKVQDHPIGYNYTARLPSGVANIRTRLRWEFPVPALLSNKGQRPRPRRVATVGDDRLLPPS
eukprot:5730634-Pyramimonas_sp.AAC.1